MSVHIFVSYSLLSCVSNRHTANNTDFRFKWITNDANYICIHISSTSISQPIDINLEHPSTPPVDLTTIADYKTPGEDDLFNRFRSFSLFNLCYYQKKLRSSSQETKTYILHTLAGLSLDSKGKRTLMTKMWRTKMWKTRSSKMFQLKFKRQLWEQK